MKIGFTLDALKSMTGKERVVYELVKFLSSGHEITIITFKNKVNDDILKEFEKLGVRFFFLIYPGAIKGRLMYLTSYKEKISNLKLDVINAHGLILSNAASLSSIPTVKTYHAHVISKEEFFSNPLRWFDYYLEESFSIYFSKMVISISNYAKNQLKTMYGRDSIVIPNGVDIKLFKPNKILREEFRNKFRFSEDEIVIGYVARFVPQKNHLLLLKIARRLPRNVRIIFVGEGKLEEKYRYLVYKLGMKRKIIFLKKLTNKDLAAFYNGIDIYAHPSFWESFGLPLLEAQSSGKPTIAFDKTAMREVILNNKTGFLVKNDKEFEEYLSFLINNEKIRRIFGRNASEFSKNFDWNKICKKYEKVFKRVVGIG